MARYTVEPRAREPDGKPTVWRLDHKGRWDRSRGGRLGASGRVSPKGLRRIKAAIARADFKPYSAKEMVGRRSCASLTTVIVVFEAKGRAASFGVPCGRAPVRDSVVDTAKLMMEIITAPIPAPPPETAP